MDEKGIEKLCMNVAVKGMTHAHYNVYSVVRYEEDNTCNLCIYALNTARENVSYLLGLCSYYNYDLYILLCIIQLVSGVRP